MTKFLKFSYAALVTLLVISVISSCKKKFDEPPSFQEPLITVTKTIAQIKALHVSGQIEAFTDDDVISGIVNANDQSGNYYKQISIQDETGGITIRLDATNLYANYPVGRKIYIKLKGLFMGDYRSLVQIGGAEDYTGTTPNVLGIPSALLETYIIKGSPGYPVPAKVVKISELNSSLQSMLIQIDSSEFADDQTNETYADAVGKVSVSLDVEPCSGGKIIVRSSGYANFAGITVPAGNGTLRAIYTTFSQGSDLVNQLVIRDTSDVQFYNTTRCNGTIITPPPPPGPLTRISIAALRAMYTGADITNLGSYQIGGVVIATDAEKNLTKGNVILQDGTSGIAVYFGGTATLTYAVGDSVVINITGADLKKFSGSLEVDAFGMTPPAKTAGGSPITPVTKTLAQINTALALPLGDPGNVEFTLVKVVSVAAPAGTYGGNKTISDATGSTTLFTRAGTTPATFAGSSFPNTCIDIIGYPLNFTSGTEIQIRNTSDVSTGTGCSTPPPPPTGSLITISALRAMYTGADVTLGSGTKIGGIIISDVNAGNVGKGNIVIQNDASGIDLYLGNVTVTGSVGDSIVVDLSGAILTKFSGFLEVKGITAANITTISSGNTVTPKVLTVAQLKAALTTGASISSSIENTLIRIVNVTPSGGATYGSASANTSRTLTDPTDNMVLWTLKTATFVTTSLPTTAKTFTGYAYSFLSGSTNTPEFVIRNTNDVQ